MRKSQRVLNIAGRDFMDDVSDDSGAEEEPGTALRPEAADETAGEDFGAEDGIPSDGNPHTPAALVQAPRKPLSPGGGGSELLESSFDAPSPTLAPSPTPAVERLDLRNGASGTDEWEEEASLMLPDSSPSRPRSPGQPYLSPGSMPSLGPDPGSPVGRGPEPDAAVGFLPSPTAAGTASVLGGTAAEVLDLGGAEHGEEAGEEELDLVEHGDLTGETAPEAEGLENGEEAPSEEEEEEDDVFDSEAISSLVNPGVEGGNWEDDEAPRDAFDAVPSAGGLSEDAAWASLQSGYGENSPELGQAPLRHSFQEQVFDADGEGYLGDALPPDLGELHSDLPSAKWALGGGDDDEDDGAGFVARPRGLEGEVPEPLGNMDLGMGVEDIEDMDDFGGMALGGGLEPPLQRGSLTPPTGGLGGPMPGGPSTRETNRAFEDRFDDFEAKFAAMSPA